jgi:hypothetical protein
VERHGSIHHLQCSAPCNHHIWSAAGLEPIVDTARCKLLSPVPYCSECGCVVRPNILMFQDMGWLESRTDLQLLQLERWLERVPDPLLIEIGAGKIRRHSAQSGPQAWRQADPDQSGRAGLWRRASASAALGEHWQGLTAIDAVLAAS